MKTHLKFHSTNGKRRILVIDDEYINRELLRNVLEGEYEVLTAENGRQGLEIIEREAKTLSLVLLDLLMPVMSGMEMLKVMQASPQLKNIPVIVLTSDQTAEVQSLELGASDFISKPYPQPAVILARVRRNIELSEDTDIISSTERDPLTDLYNREYFYRYAEQFDEYHENLPMDAVVVDIYHFRLINERHGSAYGDQILRRVGEKIREAVMDAGGIVCRREADIFMAYFPHRTDYDRILNLVSEYVNEGKEDKNRIRLRMGVYPEADKTIAVERRFDRAKAAADTLRDTVTKTIAFYDNALHERELYHERLVGDFQDALKHEQFCIHYQPKFNVQTESPFLASAEALVRWNHPELGMISPGVFIPLFEENGLIYELDAYVWEHAAEQIRTWKETLGFAVPISVNVSRIDMFDQGLVERFEQILEKYELSASEMYLEVTESAYTEDSQQIVSTVQRLRELGFHIEMDDFGMGYSSLNMLSSLPIDALKLDMQFIRTAFSGKRDTRMLKIIMEIAQSLSVPVIAEGVETQEQMEVLRAMGCAIIQGYYFSRPVPAGEYQQFLQARKGQGELESVRIPVLAQQSVDLSRIAGALSMNFDTVVYVSLEDGRYLKFGSDPDGSLQAEYTGEDFFRDISRVVGENVCDEDRERVLRALDKGPFVGQLTRNGAFAMTYRMTSEGDPVFYNLKAVLVGSPERGHAVIGISNANVEFWQDAGESDESGPFSFQMLAQTLAADMERIYYVDTKTEKYMRFAAKGVHGRLELEDAGEHFFEMLQERLLQMVYADDLDRVRAALRKDELLSVLRGRGSFSMDYRHQAENGPVFYRIKVLPAEESISHVILGISNVDAQITEQERLEAKRRSAATYSKIAQALAQDYFSIYYVNTQTEQFIEYSVKEAFAELGLGQGGGDFFTWCRENFSRMVYAKDQKKVLGTFTKENVLNELDANGTFTLTFRLMLQGVPTYVSLKATRMENAQDPHIVVGISSIDAQMRREEALEREMAAARELANRDALTGVKSKLAFGEAEERWNQDIAGGRAEPFGIAVCDLNGLKTVNDTLGHSAGDQFIRGACSIICNVFKHSPVYRIGGDEFAAILRGQDYERREELAASLAHLNDRHRVTGEVIIACGISKYRPGEDQTFDAVFDRADTRMYENKARLKEA